MASYFDCRAARGRDAPADRIITFVVDDIMHGRPWCNLMIAEMIEAAEERASEDGSHWIASVLGADSSGSLRCVGKDYIY